MPLQFHNRDITRQPVHIIYRLHGSLPRDLVKQISSEYQSALDLAKIRFEKTNGDALAEYKSEVAQINQDFQLKFDNYLDQQEAGPMFLSEPVVKRIVIDSWLFLEDLLDLEIDAISVMSNHVHILLSHAEENGRVDFKKTLHQHKSFTAKKINEFLNRQGQLWARNAFDRDVRKDAYGTVSWYVLNNPVKAGLTKAPLNWSGNYLADRLR